jgi:hypothetical protein
MMPIPGSHVFEVTMEDEDSGIQEELHERLITTSYGIAKPS